MNCRSFQQPLGVQHVPGWPSKSLKEPRICQNVLPANHSNSVWRISRRRQHREHRTTLREGTAPMAAIISGEFGRIHAAACEGEARRGHGQWGCGDFQEEVGLLLQVFGGWLPDEDAGRCDHYSWKRGHAADDGRCAIVKLDRGRQDKTLLGVFVENMVSKPTIQRAWASTSALNLLLLSTPFAPFFSIHHLNSIPSPHLSTTTKSAYTNT